MRMNDPWEAGATATPTPTDTWRYGRQKFFAPQGLVAPPGTPETYGVPSEEGRTREAREAREQAYAQYGDDAADAGYTILGIGLWLPAINPMQHEEPLSFLSEHQPCTVGEHLLKPGGEETEVIHQCQEKLDAEIMVARASSAQYEDRANSDPRCPVHNRDIAPSETHRSPLMMRCSCKCGCGQARANMNICQNATNIFAMQNVICISDATGA